MKRIVINNYTGQYPGPLQVNQEVQSFRSAFQDTQPDVMHVPRGMWKTQSNRDISAGGSVTDDRQVPAVSPTAQCQSPWNLNLILGGN